MRIRLTILLLGAVLALGACGGHNSDNKTAESPAIAHATPPAHAVVSRAKHPARPHKRATTGQKAQATPSPGSASLYVSRSRSPEHRKSDRLAGVFTEAAATCAVSTPERVARNVGSKSTDPKAIAKTLARGYLPELRKTAYKGCLSVLG
jgi:hypothetical protein